MKLDLNEIVAHLGKKIDFEMDEPPIEDLESGLKCVEPIKGKISFTNTGTLVVVRGQFSTTIELECGRCLGTYTMDLDLPIEEGLPISGTPEFDNEEIVEEDKQLEELALPLFVDNIYNLTELLRQSIVTAVPIKPLCSELCKGLCPQCGKNLTQGPCECPPETENTAFAALALLLKKKEEESDS